MSWQKCPACNGTGCGTPMQGAPGAPPCTVCIGAKIINEQTGQPPPIGAAPIALKTPVEQDLSAEQLFKQLSPFDDIDDDDIKYWATPYYDELQARKRSKQDAKNETQIAYEPPPDGRQRAIEG